MKPPINPRHEIDRGTSPGTWPTPTVVVADEHTVFAEAMETVLHNEGFDLVAIASTVGETLDAVRDLRPTVCLFHWHLADSDGVRLFTDLRDISPRTAIVVVTADPDPATAQHAIAAGAAGFVHMTLGVATLLRAIHRVIDGAMEIDLPSPRTRSARDDMVFRAANYLTEREWQCLALLADGQGTTAMAHRLGISTTTVRSYVQGLLTKLGVHSRLEAASLAVRYKLLDDRTTFGDPHTMSIS